MSCLFPDVEFQSIYEIPEDYFTSRKIQALLLDIDNTLAPYHAKEADEKALRWLRAREAEGLSLCIVSNSKEPRAAEFSIAAGVVYVSAANKPAKDGIVRALALSGETADRAALIGDQIFTDIWGGNRLGLHTVLVTPFDRKENTFIKFKRLLERPILWAYRRTKHRGE